MKRLSTFSILAVIGVLAMIFSSCTSFKVLKQPYTRSIPQSLQRGDEVKITFTSGLVTEMLIVDHIWADSMLLTNDVKAIPFRHIAEIKKLRIDPIATTILIAIPVVGLYLLIAKSVEDTTNDVLTRAFGKP